MVSTVEILRKIGNPVRRAFVSTARYGIDFVNAPYRLLALLVVLYLVAGEFAIIPYVRGLTDNSLYDQAENAAQATALNVFPPNSAIPVTFIDIDNTLFNDVWGSPLVTPRSELEKLIVRMGDGGASAIVIDIDLSWNEETPELDQLLLFLKEYSGPPMILVKRLADQPNANYAAPSAVDQVVDQNALLSWAHAHFYKDSDTTIRRWSTWQPACYHDAPVVLPAVAIKALELTHADIDIAGSGLVPAPRPPCGVSQTPPPELPILYRADFPDIMSADMSKLDAAGSAIPGLSIKARYLLEDYRVDDATLLNNRVAVIGGSYSAGRDSWVTPVGTIPGALVLANTITHAPLQLLTDDRSEWVFRIVVCVFLCILVVLPLYLRSFIALGLAVVSIFVLAILTLDLFDYYPIFNVIESAILLFVQYELVAFLVGVGADVDQYGWRAILSERLREKHD